MAKIVYVQLDGTRNEIDAGAAASVMQAAVNNDVPGIIGECGGSAMCATCHVYVDQECIDDLPPISEVENDMLQNTASERRENSRLSCQLAIDGSFDELVVHIPPTQV